MVDDTKKREIQKRKRTRKKQPAGSTMQGVAVPTPAVRTPPPRRRERNPNGPAAAEYAQSSGVRDTKDYKYRHAEPQHVEPEASQYSHSAPHGESSSGKESSTLTQRIESQLPEILAGGTPLRDTLPPAYGAAGHIGAKTEYKHPMTPNAEGTVGDRSGTNPRIPQIPLAIITPIEPRRPERLDTPANVPPMAPDSIETAVGKAISQPPRQYTQESAPDAVPETMVLVGAPGHPISGPRSDEDTQVTDISSQMAKLPEAAGAQGNNSLDPVLQAYIKGEALPDAESDDSGSKSLVGDMIPDSSNKFPGPTDAVQAVPAGAKLPDILEPVRDDDGEDKVMLDGDILLKIVNTARRPSQPVADDTDKQIEYGPVKVSAPSAVADTSKSPVIVFGSRDGKVEVVSQHPDQYRDDSQVTQVRDVREERAKHEAEEKEKTETAKKKSEDDKLQSDASHNDGSKEYQRGFFSKTRTKLVAGVLALTLGASAIFGLYQLNQYVTSKGHDGGDSIQQVSEDSPQDESLDDVLNTTIVRANKVEDTKDTTPTPQPTPQPVPQPTPHQTPQPTPDHNQQDTPQSSPHYNSGCASFNNLMTSSDAGVNNSLNPDHNPTAPGQLTNQQVINNYYHLAGYQGHHQLHDEDAMSKIALKAYRLAQADGIDLGNLAHSRGQTANQDYLRSKLCPTTNSPATNVPSADLGADQHNADPDVSISISDTLHSDTANGPDNYLILAAGPDLNIDNTHTDNPDDGIDLSFLQDPKVESYMPQTVKQDVVEATIALDLAVPDYAPLVTVDISEMFDDIIELTDADLMQAEQECAEDLTAYAVLEEAPIADLAEYQKLVTQETTTQIQIADLEEIIDLTDDAILEEAPIQTLAEYQALVAEAIPDMTQETILEEASIQTLAEYQDIVAKELPDMTQDAVLEEAPINTLAEYQVLVAKQQCTETANIFSDIERNKMIYDHAWNISGKSPAEIKFERLCERVIDSPWTRIGMKSDYIDMDAVDAEWDTIAAEHNGHKKAA